MDLLGTRSRGGTEADCRGSLCSGDPEPPYYARRGGHGLQPHEPRLAVFSHIVKLADPNNPAPADDEITERARTTWAGGLAVGKDLERFIVTAAGEERVRL